MRNTRRSYVGPLAWAALLVLIGTIGVGMAAFLRTPVGKLPPESVPRSYEPWALPPGRVAMLVPEGTRVPADWPFARPVPERRLREYGFMQVHTTSELERAVQAGAVVIWIHRDAIHWVDPAWLWARHREGYAVGVIGGTIHELWDWLTVGQRGRGWLAPQAAQPFFGLIDGRQCRPGPDGPRIEPSRLGMWPGGMSEQFSLAIVVSASHRAATFCT